jgi:hypothetical protein
MERAATFSSCGRYRWTLTRRWDADLLKPCVGFVMLNPSTADASSDDPTIRRCIGFARMWEFGGLEVRNLFAFRATKWEDLKSAPNPVGRRNDATILDLLERCETIVVAWGSHGVLHDRGRRVIELLGGNELVCLGTTQAGEPRHPLYVSGHTMLIPFRESEPIGARRASFEAAHLRYGGARSAARSDAENLRRARVMPESAERV